MDAVIDVRALRKRYDTTQAVDDVTFDVQAGEIFGVLGANGAGKTTTVECVQGLRNPDSGDIRVLGRRPNDPELRSLVGSQLQDAALPGRIRVAEALDVFSGPDAVDRDELLRAWGLDDHRRTAFAELSGGLRQRVFIALALLNRPTVVFFDELTQGLDPVARREVWEVIRSVRRAGTTVVLVTHFMEEAEALCDRLAVFHRGRIVAAGTPAEIIAGHAQRASLTFGEGQLANDPDVLTRLGSVPGVDSVNRVRGSVVVDGHPSMVAAACAALVAAGPAPPDLRIRQPSLEDAVVALEGGER